MTKLLSSTSQPFFKTSFFISPPNFKKPLNFFSLPKNPAILPGPIQSHPIHHLGMNKMLHRPPPLPNPAIRFLPYFNRLICKRTDHGPQLFIKILLIPGIDNKIGINCLDQFSINIILSLLICRVANPHRAGTLMPFQMLEDLFFNIALAVDPSTARAILK